MRSSSWSTSGRRFVCSPAGANPFSEMIRGVPVGPRYLSCRYWMILRKPQGTASPRQFPIMDPVASRMRTRQLSTPRDASNTYPFSDDLARRVFQ